jgi:hypothetical protein
MDTAYAGPFRYFWYAAAAVGTKAYMPYTKMSFELFNLRDPGAK